MLLDVLERLDVKVDIHPEDVATYEQLVMNMAHGLVGVAEGTALQAENAEPDRLLDRVLLTAAALRSLLTAAVVMLNPRREDFHLAAAARTYLAEEVWQQHQRNAVRWSALPLRAHR